MQLTLGPKVEQKLRERMRAGGYASPEEALLAGLVALEREQTGDDFAPGEWDKLLAEGETSGEPLEWADVYAELRRMGNGERTSP